jgi:REP element-mobilizing transposase RayT
MPQSHARLVTHITFSTKHRQPFLKDPELRVRLYAYMAGVLQRIDCEPILINGVEDHVHILCNLSRDIAVKKLIEVAKVEPSKWIKRQGQKDFFWQKGYGAFSVSESRVPHTKGYIARQEEHHKRVSFQEEFRELCRKHGLEVDERYVWD